MVYSMMRRTVLGLALAATFASSAGAAEPDHVAVSVALETAIQPGKTAWVAVHQTIAPGWHTYWRNPGATGQATSLTWHLPKGVSAGETLWPAPRTFADGPIVSYGYSHEVTLLVPLTAGHAAEPGPASVDVFLLECEHVCIPKQVTLPLDLHQPSGASTLFTKARAAMPRAFPGDARLINHGNEIVLALTSPFLAGVTADKSKFYPGAADAVDYERPSVVRSSGMSLVWRAVRGRHARQLRRLDGVLDIPGVGAFEVGAALMAAGAAPISIPLPETGLVQAVLMALLGGLILNLMPCVLPILSMKALALAHAGSSAEMRRDGRYYFVGVLVSFAAIAGLLVSLNAGGAALGWGFQLQSPPVVLALALLMAAIGLNLLGVFELPLALTGVGDGLTRRDGASGAFFTGALAVLVASPCTAPFMGAALGFAIAQPPLTAATVFLALGAGFALPFAALTYAPGLVRLIPKPGAWMIRFRQALAFPMFATAIWLLWVLGQQTGNDGVALALSIGLGLLFIGWLVPMVHRRLRLALATAGLAAAVVLGTGFGHAGNNSGWRPWSAEAVGEAQRAGHPVLVDFSAAWCVTCLVNERSTLQNPGVRQRLQRDGVVTLKADWTNRDAAIASELGRFGRSGVPLYLLYPGKPHASARVLPQLLTPAVLNQALDKV